MKTIISTIAATALFATMATAGGDIAPVETPVVETNKDFYVGVGITGLTTYVNGEKDYTDDTIDSEISGGLEVKAGYVFFRDGAISVAVEAQAGRSFWGFGEDDDFYSYNYAAFIKPAYAVTDEVAVYGLAGFAKSGISDGDDTIQENGFAYGIGAEYAFTDEVAIYADYTMLPAFTEDGFEDINNDKVALGINYRF